MASPTGACPRITSGARVKTVFADSRPTISIFIRCITSIVGTPWEEVWQAMELLVQQGKVSISAAATLLAGILPLREGAAKARHFMGLISERRL